MVLTRDNPFLILANAASGSADAGEEHARITDTLAAAGQRFELLPVRNPKELPAMAKQAALRAQREQGAVIVAGGDGTINAAVQAVLPTGRPFGIVPQGTFNYSSRAHGIPLETVAATRALIDASLKPVQVGLVNERVFLVNASLGLYSQVLQDREAYKQQLGRHRAVAMLSGLMTLLRGYRQLALHVEYDNRREVLITPSLFVGNNPLQLQQVGLPEADAVQHRRLAAIIVKPVGTAALLGLAVRGALGQLGAADNIRDFAFARMTVNPAERKPTRTRTIKVATDGEIWRARMPIHFSVAAKPLLLMTPATKPRSG